MSNTENETGIRLTNTNLLTLNKDVLYHLGLDTENYDLPTLFGDVKFVCMGGTKYRMRDFAVYISQVLGCPEMKPTNLTKHSHRYALYKIGPVLSVSHGIGIPSMSILLQEVIKLLHYAKAKNPVFFRIGTSGGLGLPPGSVVVSKWALNGLMEKSYDLPILGQLRKMPSVFDEKLCEELVTLASADKRFLTVAGGTMAADDFYQGQGRTDGPFCNYTEEDKLKFLLQLSDLGVKNIEMEATAFAAFTKEAGLLAADVCVTLIDRLKGDQVTPSKSTIQNYQEHPMIVVGNYIVKSLKKN